MAVWTARKIQELRHIKAKRCEYRKYASVEIAGGSLRVRSESETDEFLAEWFRSDAVQGEALKRLDHLPRFGSSSIESFEVWRKFVRRRLLTPKILTEFNLLFPNSRRKLDGVLAATLRCAWDAAGHGGDVILQ
jgi:hypothetical protein